MSIPCLLLWACPLLPYQNLSSSFWGTHLHKHNFHFPIYSGWLESTLTAQPIQIPPVLHEAPTSRNLSWLFQPMEAATFRISIMWIVCKFFSLHCGLTALEFLPRKIFSWVVLFVCVPPQPLYKFLESINSIFALTLPPPFPMPIKAPSTQ